MKVKVKDPTEFKKHLADTHGFSSVRALAGGIEVGLATAAKILNGDVVTYTTADKLAKVIDSKVFDFAALVED